MEIVQAVKKLNSISQERLNFRRWPILCTRIETLYKRATSVAHLTVFSFEFFYEIFTQDAPLLLVFHGAKKSKMTKNSNQGGPAQVMRQTDNRTGCAGHITSNPGVMDRLHQSPSAATPGRFFQSNPSSPVSRTIDNQHSVW